MFARLFGSSLFLIILDLFLDNPEDIMNLNEIARRVDRNPGSIIRVLPQLLEMNYIVSEEVSKSRKVYRLNKKDPIVKEFIAFRKTVSNTIPEAEDSQ